MRVHHWEAANPEFDEAFRQIRWHDLIRAARGTSTQFHLACELGVSQSVLARLESGRHVPTLRTLCRIAAETGTAFTASIRTLGDTRSATFDGARFLERRSDLRRAAALERQARSWRDRHR